MKSISAHCLGSSCAIVAALTVTAVMAQTPGQARDYDAEIRTAMAAAKGETGGEGIQNFFNVVQDCARAAQIALERQAAAAR